MERPYTMCLMMTSMDGKILTDNWGDAPGIEKLKGKFEDVHERIGVKAWIVGRKTMEKDFTYFTTPILKPGEHSFPREDFVANPTANSFAIAMDAQAKLGWRKPDIEKDHVITILTETVADAYLAHLRDIGVSYIFGGESTIDLPTALNKLRTKFGIEKLMVEGGGYINGSFLNAGLIDEIHQVLLPIADGSADSATMFDIDRKVKAHGATLFRLHEVRRIDDDVLWLTYTLKSPTADTNA